MTHLTVWCDQGCRIGRSSHGRWMGLLRSHDEPNVADFLARSFGVPACAFLQGVGLRMPSACRLLDQWVIRSATAMGLTLDSADVQRLVRLQETLLSPLEGADVAAWCERIVQSAGELFHCDRVIVLFPHGEGPLQRWGPAMDPWADTLEQIAAGMRPYAGEFGQREVDEALSARRQAGLAVWSNAMLAEMLDREITDFSFYHDFFVPAGTLHGGGMTVGLPTGEAMVGATPGPPHRTCFGDDWLELFHLVLPAFRAGAVTLAEWQRTEKELGRVADDLSVPLLIVDGMRKVVHRSEALGALPARGEELEELVSAARTLGGQVACGVRSRDRRPTPSGERWIRVSGRRYRITAVRLPSRVADRGDLALVLIRCGSPVLPDRQVLMDRFGLTAREAEVALLLAQGASNKRAAKRLGISPHTVRSHAERIFGKVGIRSRKALALRLLDL